MTHRWVMDNNCVKYYPDWTREYEVMARTRCEQTDGQTDGHTDRVIPIYPPPPTLFAGGIITAGFPSKKCCLKKLEHIHIELCDF